MTRRSRSAGIVTIGLACLPDRIAEAIECTNGSKAANRPAQWPAFYIVISVPARLFWGRCGTPLCSVSSLKPFGFPLTNLDDLYGSETRN